MLLLIANSSRLAYQMALLKNYCIKAAPKVINSRALTSEKPCINMEFHAPLKHRFLTIHM